MKKENFIFIICLILFLLINKSIYSQCPGCTNNLSGNYPGGITVPGGKVYCIAAGATVTTTTIMVQQDGGGSGTLCIDGNLTATSLNTSGAGITITLTNNANVTLTGTGNAINISGVYTFTNNGSLTLTSGNFYVSGAGTFNNYGNISISGQLNNSGATTYNNYGEIDCNNINNGGGLFLTKSGGCSYCASTPCWNSPSPTSCVSASLSANAGSAQISCSGSSVTLGGSPTARGGSSPYTYAWSASSGTTPSSTSNPTISPTTSTTYLVTVSDAASNTAISSVAITVNTTSTSPTSISGINTIFTGSSTTLSVNGGINGTSSTINWSTGSCGNGNAFTQEWFTQPYTTANTTVNGSNGILDVTSTTGDPQITMNNLGSFDPTIYKYIQIRYKVVSGNAGSVEIFYLNTRKTGASADQRVPSALISDNAWHVLNIDMYVGTYWTGNGNITGWRFDYCTANAVNIQIDYIALGSAQAVDQGSSISVTPSSTTTYYALRSGACNITSCASTTVTVVPLLFANAGSSNTVCSGTTITLGGSPTGSGGRPTLAYSWASSPSGFTSTSANPTASPTVNTTYTVTVTENGGSGLTATSSVAISINSLPVPTFTSGPTTACIGSTSNIYATQAGMTNYIWNISLGGSITGGGSGNDNTVTVTWNNSGAQIVSINYKNGNGCTANDSTVQNVIVNDLPTVTAGGGTICNGNTTNITANGASTFVWSDGFRTGNSISVNPITNTTYTVTGTDGSNCSNTANAIVNVNTLPTANAQSSGTAACSGSSVTLSANASSGTSPYTYVWSNGAIPSDNSTPTANIIANTTYTVTITDINSCSATSSVAVNMNALPSANAQSSGTAACNGSSVTLNANASSGTIPYTYNWSSGATPSNNSTPTANIIANITYTVTVTDNNNCTATSSIAVNMNTLPTANAQSSAIAACNGSSVTLSANASSGTIPYTFVWSSGAIPIDNSTPIANIIANTIYTVTVTDNNNCTATSSVAVNMNVLPTANAQLSATAACNGSSVTLNANASSGTNPYTYAWSTGATPADNSTTSTNIIANTTYTVTVTDNNNCTATSSVAVNMNALPNVTAGGGAVCIGESQNITAVGAVTYNWSDGLGSGDTKSVNPTTSTTYTVTGIDANSCSNTANAIVTIYPLPIVTAGGRAICVGASLNITAGGASTYVWSNGLGSGNTKLVIPTTSTTYTVTGTSDKNCSNTDEAIVTVNPLPTGDFSAQTLETEVNNEIIFTSNNISNASIWNWQFGDGESNNDANSTKHSYKDAGQYNVILTLTSSQGCKTGYSKYNYITIKNLTKIWVPTAFTPNGDGQNDELFIYGEFKSIDIKIYNQWGIRVCSFSHDGQSSGTPINVWDGKCRGIEQPEGNYSYIVHAINNSNKEVIEQGIITLLR